MQLKHRLSLYAVVIFSIIILVVSMIIYVSFYSQMEKKEQEALESKTLLSAIFYLEKDELPLLEHEHIRSQLLKTISRRNIVVYDESNKHFSGDMSADPVINEDFVSLIRQRKSSFQTSSDYFYHGMFYEDNQGDFVVITREPREEFNAQMQSLLHILIVVSLIGLVLIYLFSRYLGHVAYEPIIKIVDQIKRRDHQNFNQPLELKKSYKEIQDLVVTYNHFVDRISQTFHVQKNFIDYVSHELRTPITALLGTLEVTDHKQRRAEEYVEVIQQLKQYTNDLQETLDHMMLLSGAKTSFEFRPIRVDEIIWQVIEAAVLFHGAKIEVDIQVEDTMLLQIDGNEKLLELAFNNIIENAIKYSGNRPIAVELSNQSGKLQVVVRDQGIGILSEDLQHIKQNFFRGQNTKSYQGKGIGLSMANIIFSLHQIQLDIDSKGTGTEVYLKF